MEVGWSFGDIGYERLRLDFVHVWPSQDHEQLSRPGVSSSRRLRAAGRQDSRGERDPEQSKRSTSAQGVLLLLALAAVRRFFVPAWFIKLCRPTLLAQLCIRSTSLNWRGVATLSAGVGGLCRYPPASPVSWPRGPATPDSGPRRPHQAPQWPWSRRGRARDTPRCSGDEGEQHRHGWRAWRLRGPPARWILGAEP